MPAATSRMLLLTALSVVCAAACGSRTYGYAPLTSTSGQIVGHPAAELPFPPDSPQGNVRLATLGLAPPTAESPRSIHVRMIATNGGLETWVIDKGEQELAVDVGDEQRTTMVRAIGTPRTAPVRLEVRPGETATVDLYFPLPRGAQDAKDVPAFDALWVVHAGPRTITTRTPFERFVASSPAQNARWPAYPYTPRTSRERQPATPDPRWPADDPTLMPDPVPRPPLP